MPVSGLKKGFYYEFVSATADYIEADKAVLVAQYMPSMAQCGYKGLGDPEIVYLSPLEQAIEHLGFFRNTDLAIQVNYLTLIIPDQGLTSLKIDGSQSFTYKYPHPNRPGYTVVVQRWPATKSQCIVDSDSAFTSVTYGVGVAESYAFNGGTLVNNLNGTLSLHNVEGKAGVQHPFTCTNSPVEISLLMTYEPTKLVWHLSELTKMTPNADITENNPVSKGIVTIKGLSYYKYTVPGTYNFSETGTFRFTVSSTNPAIENYNNIENLLLDVVVKDVNYTAAFDYTFSGCISDLVHFKWDPTPAAGVYTIDRWAWTIPEGPVGVKDTANRLFSSNGTKDITLKVITEEGCIGSKTKQIKLEFPVVMKITASPLEICEDETIDFEATATNTGSAPISGWYWDFGNGQTATMQNPQDVKYTAYRDSYTVKMVGKAGKDCVTDTVTQVIKVNARPYTRFSYPAGCLPADGVIAFTSEATAPDGSLLRTHAWNFGDGNASAANPNTSAQASPSHAFGLGSYDIHYTVTTEKGCQKDTLVKAQFTVKPQMTFASLASVCENAVVLSIAKATVTNSVPGTGVYKGKGTDAAGNFDPVMAGPGLHEIKYIFTSTGGCMDSVTSNITVWAAPKAAFSITKDACPGKDVTITDQSPAVSPPISTWYWQLGDNSSVTNNNGNAFTKNYTDPKSYEVQLTVTDTRGCASTVTKQTVTIHQVPKAAFTPPAAICLPGEATFTNQSTTADNSALQYEWNMGDGSAVRTTKDATHTYASAGTYPVSLKVTTAYGCIAAASQQVKNFYNKPTALFTVAPQAVCQGKDHVFTDKSTTPNGSISSWKWDFDDGNITAQRNPVKQYATAGSYTVKLVVTDVVGCISTAYPLPVTAYVQPVIDAGEMISVVKGSAVTFKATANRPDAMQFAWTPAAELTNANTLSPTYIAMHDEVFTLTATSNQGNCTATDQLTVKVLKIITPPTAFTPNGDGIHDKWEIEGLSEYLQCQVQVFNRYGQSVYLSTGYNKPWDGTMNSKLLPAGTYYYIIADKGSSWQRIAGAVTIIR
jgi:gliding motility-associated-like protein